MASWRKKHWWAPETPKDNNSIPEGLGIGAYEVRNDNGELIIYFHGNPTTKGSWVVLGKYAKPDGLGKQFYVADKLHGNWAGAPTVTHHEDLLMAVSFIMDLKQKWDSRKG